MLKKEKKTKVISRIRAPRNVTEFKAFLGRAGFLKKFVPNFADATNPLDELLKINIELICGKSQMMAFEGIKQKL